MLTPSSTASAVGQRLGANYVIDSFDVIGVRRRRPGDLGLLAAAAAVVIIGTSAFFARSAQFIRSRYLPVGRR